MSEEDFFSPFALSKYLNFKWKRSRISYRERVQLSISWKKRKTTIEAHIDACNQNEWMNRYTNKNLPCAIWKSIVWAANHHETISILVQIALNKLFIHFYGIQHGICVCVFCMKSVYNEAQMDWKANSEQVGDKPIKWTMYAYRNIDRKMIDEHRWWLGCPYIWNEKIYFSKRALP